MDKGSFRINLDLVGHLFQGGFADFQAHRVPLVIQADNYLPAFFVGEGAL